LQSRRGGLPVPLRKKDLALLVFLRVEPEAAFTRARLASLLWANTTDERARHSLSQALSRLQKALGTQALATDSQTVRLSLRIQCDADEALRSVTAVPSGNARFLDGFHPGEGAEEFADWADRERAAIGRAMVELLEEAGSAAEEGEDWAQALAYAKRSVQLDPYWERGHRRLMRGLEARGERSLALRHYEEFSAWMLRETGDAPDGETRALAERIRQEPLSAPRSAPASAVTGTGAWGGGAQPRNAGAADAPPAAATSRDGRQPVPSVSMAAAAASARAYELLMMAVGVILLLLVGRAVVLGGRGMPFSTRSDTPALAGLTEAKGGTMCRAGAAVARFVGETFPDNAPVRPGTPFVKSWTIRNTGSCTWDGHFTLRFESARPSVLSNSGRIPLHRPVPPNDTVVFEVPMRAPVTPGMYLEHWSLRDPEGAFVQISSSRTMWAKVIVPDPSAPPCTANNAVAKFVRETMEDGSVVVASETFLKSWVLRNDGACTWPRTFSLRYVSSEGTRMSIPDSVPLGRLVRPGEEYRVRVPMRAPSNPGVYEDYWRLADMVGDTVRVSGSAVIWAKVEVADPSPK
jgi:DNA-binding SARP family transcriptional activator